MSTILEYIEKDDNIVLYALDETSIKLEPRNYYSWSLIGHPNVIEKNGTKKGLNIIGATELLKTFKSDYHSYPNDIKN